MGAARSADAEAVAGEAAPDIANVATGERGLDDAESATGAADEQVGGGEDSGRPARSSGPPLPEGLEDVKLSGEVRRELLGLRKGLAEEVGRHLVAAGALLDDDPRRALEHARYARNRASRLAVVREAAGLAAYRAGEWAEAIAELRAARRMGGGPGHLAILADCERALGRPERALDLARSPEVAELDEAEAIELRIVAAGARRDMGEVDAAVVSLRIPELDPAHRRPWSARLFYAYADALLAAGRRDEAVRWFLHAADADDDELTDATERLGELIEPTAGDDDSVDAAHRAAEPIEAGGGPAESAGSGERPPGRVGAGTGSVQQIESGDRSAEPIESSERRAKLIEPEEPAERDVAGPAEPEAEGRTQGEWDAATTGRSMR